MSDRLIVLTSKPLYHQLTVWLDIFKVLPLDRYHRIAAAAAAGASVQYLSEIIT